MPRVAMRFNCRAARRKAKRQCFHSRMNPTPTTLSPESLAPALRALSLIGAQRDLTEDESLQMELALVALLEQPRELEEAIVSQLLDELYELPEAADFFLSELELASMLVHLGPKEDQAVLLTAVPVIFLAGANPRPLALTTDAARELAGVLLDSNVVSGHARVALLPRLFRVEELAAQSYGTLRNMTRLMGRQMLDGEPVRLVPDLFGEGPHKLDPAMAWGDNPYVELRFMVGAVLTHVSELDDVFPAVDMDEDAAEADDGDDDGQDGAERWDEVFLDGVDDAFFPMFPSQVVALPNDFHEAMREGLSLWRQSGLQQQLRSAFADVETVVVTAQPFIDQETGRHGWDLQLKDDAGRVRDQGPWEVLHHEGEEDARELLEGLAEREGLTLGSVPRVYPDQ